MCFMSLHYESVSDNKMANMSLGWTKLLQRGNSRTHPVTVSDRRDVQDKSHSSIV